MVISDAKLHTCHKIINDNMMVMMPRRLITIAKMTT